MSEIIEENPEKLEEIKEVYVTHFYDLNAEVYYIPEHDIFINIVDIDLYDPRIRMAAIGKIYEVETEISDHFALRCEFEHYINSGHLEYICDL